MTPNHSSKRCSKQDIFRMVLCLMQKFPWVRLHGKAFFMLEKLSNREQSGGLEMGLKS